MANIIYSKDLLEKGGGVYKLYLASDVDTFYIGSTFSFSSRYRAHKSKLAHGKHSKIMQEHFAGVDLKELVMEVIDISDDIVNREQYWINILSPKLNTSKLASSKSGANSVTMYNNLGKKVKVFESILSVNKSIGCGSGVINRHIQKGSKTPTNGMYFLKGSENPDIILTRGRRHKNQVSVSVLELDTGLVYFFNSFRLAAKSKLISRSTLLENRREGVLEFIHKNKYKINLIE